MNCRLEKAPRQRLILCKVVFQCKVVVSSAAFTAENEFVKRGHGIKGKYSGK